MTLDAMEDDIRFGPDEGWLSYGSTRVMSIQKLAWK
jgi:hypothetical protein